MPAVQPLEDLRRVRLARHVFLAQYITRADLQRVLEVLGTRHRAFSGTADIQATYGASEWYATESGEKVSVGEAISKQQVQCPYSK